MEIISGSLDSVVANFGCGGCGKRFKVDVSVGEKIPSGWSMFDVALDSIRAGFESCSIQGGYILCAACTTLVDSRNPEDRNATEAEVARIFQDEDSY